jgi:hypothetical protein
VAIGPRCRSGATHTLAVDCGQWGKGTIERKGKMDSLSAPPEDASEHRGAKDHDHGDGGLALWQLIVRGFGVRGVKARNHDVQHVVGAVSGTFAAIVGESSVGPTSGLLASALQLNSSLCFFRGLGGVKEAKARSGSMRQIGPWTMRSRSTASGSRQQFQRFAHVLLVYEPS